MDDKSILGSRASAKFAELHISFHLWCVETFFDVLSVVVTVLAIYAVQNLVTALFPTSPAASVQVLEIIHQVMLVASSTVILYRRLRPLVRRP